MKISIARRDYTISCPKGEEQSLQEAANYLDLKMREIQKNSKVIGSEHCAVMAALNMANELLHLKGENGDSEELEKRLKALNNKIDQALQEQQQLTI